MATGEIKSDRRFLKAALVLGFFLLAFAGYHSLRGSAGRLFSDFFYPYLTLVKKGTDKLSDQSLLIYNRLELAARLEELQAANSRLAAEAAAGRELQKENAALRNILRLPSPPGWNYLSAEIILRDPNLWNERFTVNRGSRDGVRPGASILTVTSEGAPLFIGVVDRVSERTADVITLQSPSLRISVLLTESGAIGVTNTGERHPIAGSIPVGHLPADLSYAIKEPVVTTGFERRIPGGVHIGALVAAEEQPSQFSGSLTLSGLIKPAARFDNLRFLVIAGRTGDTAP